MKPRVLMAQVDKIKAAYAARIGAWPYVIRTSNPPTEAERDQMRMNATAGKPFVLMPRGCGSIAEWMSRYAPSSY